MGSESRTDPPGRASLVWPAVGYSLMVAGTVAAFFVIRNFGEKLAAPAAPAAEVAAQSASKSPDTLLHVLVALTAVIVVGQVLAKLFAYLHQPPVIGEVVAGILLGPSLLGPDLSARVLPPAVAPYLGVVAQLGVILYMFLVGLELNAGLLRHRAHAVVTTSHASILAPFLLGALLALFLYPRFSHGGATFTSFSLFLGVALSITAFPVLARILADRNMTRTELGTIALSCAATGDVTAWCLLALVVGVAKAQVGTALLVLLGTLAYIAIMFLAVRPFLAHFASQWKEDRLSRGPAAVIFVALLASALATEAIGIHAIFGAFLLGAVIPHDSGVARAFTRQLEQLVTILLLPAFFAYMGMRTRIDLVSGLDQWLICGVIILVATVGKFSGTVAAARLTGMRWHDATVLGTLMNTRGLMELIVLNIGLELRIISETLFAMMVLMALATTMMASPVLAWLKPETEV